MFLSPATSSSFNSLSSLVCLRYLKMSPVKAFQLRSRYLKLWQFLEARRWLRPKFLMLGHDRIQSRLSSLILVDLEMDSKVLLVRRVARRSRVLRLWQTLELRYRCIPLSLMLIHLVTFSTSRQLRCCDSAMAYIVGLPNKVQPMSSSSSRATFSLFRQALKEFSSMEQLFNSNTLIFFKYLLLPMCQKQPLREESVIQMVLRFIQYWDWKREGKSVSGVEDRSSLFILSNRVDLASSLMELFLPSFLLMVEISLLGRQTCYKPWLPTFLQPVMSISMNLQWLWELVQKCLRTSLEMRVLDKFNVSKLLKLKELRYWIKLGSSILVHSSKISCLSDTEYLVSASAINVKACTPKNPKFNTSTPRKLSEVISFSSPASLTLQHLLKFKLLQDQLLSFDIWNSNQLDMKVLLRSRVSSWEKCWDLRRVVMPLSVIAKQLDTWNSRIGCRRVDFFARSRRNSSSIQVPLRLMAVMLHALGLRNSLDNPQKVRFMLPDRLILQRLFIFESSDPITSRMLSDRTVELRESPNICEEIGLLVKLLKKVSLILWHNPTFKYCKWLKLWNLMRCQRPLWVKEVASISILLILFIFQLQKKEAMAQLLRFLQKFRNSSSKPSTALEKMNSRRALSEMSRQDMLRLLKCLAPSLILKILSPLSAILHLEMSRISTLTCLSKISLSSSSQNLVFERSNSSPNPCFPTTSLSNSLNSKALAWLIPVRISITCFSFVNNLIIQCCPQLQSTLFWSSITLTLVMVKGARILLMTKRISLGSMRQVLRIRAFWLQWNFLQYTLYSLSSWGSAEPLFTKKQYPTGSLVALSVMSTLSSLRLQYQGLSLSLVPLKKRNPCPWNWLSLMKPSYFQYYEKKMEHLSEGWLFFQLPSKVLAPLQQTMPAPSFTLVSSSKAPSYSMGTWGQTIFFLPVVVWMISTLKNCSCGTTTLFMIVVMLFIRRDSSKMYPLSDSFSWSISSRIPGIMNICLPLITSFSLKSREKLELSVRMVFLLSRTSLNCCQLHIPMVSNSNRTRPKEYTSDLKGLWSNTWSFLSVLSQTKGEEYSLFGGRRVMCFERLAPYSKCIFSERSPFMMNHLLFSQNMVSGRMSLRWMLSMWEQCTLSRSILKMGHSLSSQILDLSCLQDSMKLRRSDQARWYSISATPLPFSSFKQTLFSIFQFFIRKQGWMVFGRLAEMFRERYRFFWDWGCSFSSTAPIQEVATDFVAKMILSVLMRLITWQP